MTVENRDRTRRRRNAALKASETKGPEERKRAALMATETFECGFCASFLPCLRVHADRQGKGGVGMRLLSHGRREEGPDLDTVLPPAG
jgi:hypothetical protein